MKMIKTIAVLASLLVGCAADGAWLAIPEQPAPLNPLAVSDSGNYVLLSPAYSLCDFGSRLCGGYTTCINFQCQYPCAAGNAAMCPEYIPDAAIQSVACINSSGVVGAWWCIHLCDPANANRDCARYHTTCSRDGFCTVN